MKQKRQQKPRKPKNNDVSLDDQYMAFNNVHESPLFWVDISPESQLALIQEKLIEIEKRAVRLVKNPKRLLRRLKSTLRFS